MLGTQEGLCGWLARCTTMLVGPLVTSSQWELQPSETASQPGDQVMAHSTSPASSRDALGVQLHGSLVSKSATWTSSNTHCPTSPGAPAKTGLQD